MSSRRGRGEATPEPQDAVPATPRDADPDASRWLRGPMTDLERWEQERQHERELLAEYAGADPETMAVAHLVNSEITTRVEMRQVYATRAAAWASLAVLRELKAQRPEPQDAVPPQRAGTLVHALGNWGHTLCGDFREGDTISMGDPMSVTCQRCRPTTD